MGDDKAKAKKNSDFHILSLHRGTVTNGGKIANNLLFPGIERKMGSHWKKDLSVLERKTFR